MITLMLRIVDQGKVNLLIKIKYTEDTLLRQPFLQDENSEKYYKNVQKTFSETFVDLDQLNKTTGKVVKHSMLSTSYRRAATISLKFRFPFYGHEVENITIATGGFLYTGTYVHSWLAATQYIAPLMANFDTSQDENAMIRYAYTDNGE